MIRKIILNYSRFAMNVAESSNGPIIMRILPTNLPFDFINGKLEA